MGIGFSGFAQDDTDEYTTIITKKEGNKTKVSGFGGITTEFSQVDGNFGFSLGGQAAVLLDRSVFIGFYGQGVVNFPRYELTIYSEKLNNNIVLPKNLIFFHAGIYTGYVFMPKKPFHFGLSAKFGWGGITLVDEFYNYNSKSNSGDPEVVDFIFAVTPQAEFEMNITNWFKLNMGVGYRFVTGVDAKYTLLTDDGLEIREYFASDAMDSMTFSVGFLFGWYK